MEEWRHWLEGAQQNFTLGSRWSPLSTGHPQSALVTPCLGFVTVLLVSHGNSLILTIVDRFSKAAHFLALPKLPSAFESAQLLIQAFQTFGNLCTSFAVVLSSASVVELQDLFDLFKRLLNFDSFVVKMFPMLSVAV